MAPPAHTAPCLWTRGTLATTQWKSTDDARLVLRLLFDAMALGATAMNYTQAHVIAPGRVRLRDHIDGDVREIDAAMVVNATGAWQDATRGAPTLRPLRSMLAPTLTVATPTST